MKGIHELQITVDEELYQRLLKYKGKLTWTEMLEGFTENLDPPEEV
jgi:hypothetical protein